MLLLLLVQRKYGRAIARTASGVVRREPKALANALGLPSDGGIINGVLEVEVTGVAAAVSGMIEMTQSIYKKIDRNMFELVNSPI